jgi:hypothetical protein
MTGTWKAIPVGQRPIWPISDGLLVRNHSVLSNAAQVAPLRGITI